MRSADTAVEAHRAQRSAHRELSPVERLELTLRMSDEFMSVSTAGIRSRRPDLTEAQVISELHRVLSHPDSLR